jgi:hypothetical protein
MPGDKVYLELSIYHPKHIYLTGEVPVSVLAPGGAGLHFAQPQYDLSSPHFPLIIMFEVTREAPARPYTLRLGLRVSYADKADDVVQTRHVVLSVPLLITKRLPRRPKIVHVPLEHYLQLDLDEKHK